MEYDLSQVFFIATANVMHTIPAALQDRMEVIRLSGYTELEKMEIAKRFLVKKQMEATGLSGVEIDFKDDGIGSLIQYYTREAGVRNLEREIGNVCRKIARQVVNNQGGKDKKKLAKAVINGEKVPELLGPWKFRDLVTDKKNEIGAATGLAWTEVGGQILTVECTLMEGKGKLTITGKLGEVMQESAQAAMSYIRSRALSPRPAARFLPQPRRPHSHSRGRHSQGRTLGRHHAGHHHLQRADQNSGARRSGHDRRNHAARQGAAHRRPQGEVDGRAPPWHPGSDHAAGE